MGIDWQLREAGPADARQTVLLLPGGMCSAGSYAELMAEPALAGTRLVAATFPGHAGAPPPDDYTIENYAHLTAELAANVGPDVIVGFSMGAVSLWRWSPLACLPARPSCSASLCQPRTSPRSSVRSSD